jgi:membrane protein DedA with SNARE-associated domain
MWLDAWNQLWPYLLIVAGAAIEGEVLYSGAAVLVGLGRLDAVSVMCAGALGAALGDQFYFYLLRGRLSGLLDRVPPLARRRPAIVNAVRRSETIIVLAIRFSPGFRIAMAAACAYAGVRSWKFSLLNAASAVVWASALLVAVAWVGPAISTQFGLSGAWAAVLPAIVLVIVVRALGRASKQALQPAAGNQHASS